MQKSKTGLAKLAIYLRIAGHVAWVFRRQCSPRFLVRAARLLLAFRHNKVVACGGSYKLNLYLPAYPGRAFFRAVEGKLLRQPASPVSVVFSTTRACAFRCRHCYQRLDTGRDLGEAELRATARAVRDAGVSFFNIEGGDALLKFDSLLGVLEELGEGVEVWVNTTGANVTRERLQRLKAAGMAGIMVSIHGATAERHDKFVGVEGAFGMACEALREAAGLGLRTAINTVLDNAAIAAGDLDRIMELGRELGCGHVQLIHPKRAGMWLANSGLNAGDSAMLETVRRSYHYYNSRKARTYPALPAQVCEEQPESFGCTAGGIDRFYIGSTGEVQPCEFLNISFGNVKEEGFDAIFRRMREAFPEPCCDWLCVTQADAIGNLMRKHGLTSTPLPRQYTEELVETWRRGEPTALYRKLGIYRD